MLVATELGERRIKTNETTPKIKRDLVPGIETIVC